jgi:hypothetical protein
MRTFGYATTFIYLRADAARGGHRKQHISNTDALGIGIYKKLKQ